MSRAVAEMATYRYIIWQTNDKIVSKLVKQGANTGNSLPLRSCAEKLYNKKLIFTINEHNSQ